MSETPPSAALEIREYRPGDEHAVLAAFNRVFARVDPGFEPRDLATWRWQFLENPGGWRMMLAFSAEGDVVCQYAGFGQRMLVEGRPARFSVSVDSFSDPERRSGLARDGAFVRTGRPYAERYGGPLESEGDGAGAGEGPGVRDAVMWGLPVPAAWRIGARSLGYELVRTPLLLEAEPERLAPGARGAAPGVAGLRVEDAEGVPAGLDELFARVAREHGAICVRDAAWLAWRFLRHPRNRYRLAAARGADGGGPAPLRGLAVYRAGVLDGAPAGLVVDWLVPADDAEAARGLWRWLAERARDDGLARLVALVPDTAPAWLAFQEAGFRARPWSAVLAARSYDRSIDREFLRKRWWHTLADTDLA